MKQVLCQICGEPIRKDQVGGLNKNGWFHTICAVFLADAIEKHEQIKVSERIKK